MNITINGEAKQVDDGATIAALLQSLDLDARHLAVERNLELVPRAEHARTTLQAGDRLEVVTLVGGG